VNLDAAWKIGARFPALKTARNLGAFDENLHADEIPYFLLQQSHHCVMPLQLTKDSSSISPNISHTNLKDE